MFVLAHLGIGLKIASPWSRRLPKKWLLLGTILPDLIDKPLYYIPSLLTDLKGAELGIIAGTRSFAHTAIFLLLMTSVAAVFRLRWLAALSLGVATHLLLDNVGDRILFGHEYTARALVWPFLGQQFPVFPFHDIHGHLGRIKEPYLMITETIGALILGWEMWKIRKRREIAHWIRRARS